MTSCETTLTQNKARYYAEVTPKPYKLVMRYVFVFSHEKELFDTELYHQQGRVCRKVLCALSVQQNGVLKIATCYSVFHSHLTQT